MGLCLNNQKAIIQWQYPGEEKQQILGADNYSTKPGYNDPHQFLWYWKGTATWRSVYGGAATVRDYTVGELRSGAYTVGLVAGYPRFDLINLPNENTNYLSIPYEQVNAQGQVNYNYGFGLYLSRTSYPVSFTLTELCVSRGGSSPYQCAISQPATTNCKFSITKNGQVVYQKIAPQCPVVTHTCGEQCPTGSCECSCGSDVCCYDSVTGELVKTFRK